MSILDVLHNSFVRSVAIGSCGGFQKCWGTFGSPYSGIIVYLGLFSGPPFLEPPMLGLIAERVHIPSGKCSPAWPKPTTRLWDS